MAVPEDQIARQVRDRVSLVLSFFLSLSLVSLATLMVVRYGLFMPGPLYGALSETYFEGVLENVEKSALYFTLPSGIDPVVVEDAFTVEDVKREVGRYLEYSFSGREYACDSNVTGAKLSKNVYDTNRDQGIDIEPQIVNGYVRDIMGVFARSVRIPGLSEVLENMGVVQVVFMVGVAVTVGMMFSLSVLIYKLYDDLLRVLRYLIYAFAAAALMMVLLPGVLYCSGAFTGLRLEPAYFVELVTCVARHTLFDLILSGVGFAIIALLMRVFGVSYARRSRDE